MIDTWIEGVHIEVYPSWESFVKTPMENAKDLVGEAEELLEAMENLRSCNAEDRESAFMHACLEMMDCYQILVQLMYSVNPDMLARASEEHVADNAARKKFLQSHEEIERKLLW